MTTILEFQDQDYNPGSRNRTRAHSITASYLRSLGLPMHAIESLISSARTDSRRRGDVLAYGQEWIHIVGRGVIKETTPHGTERLWRQGAILGDISRVMLRKGTTDESGSRGTGPHITFLSTGTCMSLTARTFATLIEKEPVLALLLAQLTNERSQNVESVYAASKADPVIRVARLLDYLLEPPARTRKGLNRYRWTRTGVHPVPSEALTLTGPSQADIASALGLGRTTVEKAIAALRVEGVLAALAPGTRSNRYFQIMDSGRLRSLARSES
ncbi:Crp/Fnr family transcriptional regulator [Streptomyces sp. NPDC056401]|uniref:Crp/Fnr family transcriptional regulator n=1 Tax=Streptomyces sp. NPDC056401 TaxID=3345809 RepID=UPI0035E081A7